MGISMLQPSFASGELAPALYARVDLAKYQTGLKLCSNFYVMPYGGVRNRPGMVFVNESKDSAKRARLIPFQFNDQQTYVLEFGDQYMRVYKDGGIVVYASGPSAGQVFELATPYLEANLFDLNFTQSADVMTLVHPSYEPRELSRLDHDNWTLSVISFVPGIDAPANLASTGGGSGSQDSGYKVTAVRDAEKLEESLPTAALVISNHAVLSATNVINLTWDAVPGARYYNVYKDDNESGIYGFLGRAETPTFRDRGNVAPAKADTPPIAVNPFDGSGNYPGSVGYYQQRLVFAGSNNQPQTVWMSRTGNFKNFGYSTPTKDDDAITFTIASRQVNRFRHLLPLRDLLGLTTGGEWLIGGSESGLTAKTVRAQAQSYVGASKIPPIVVNSSAIYIQGRGNRVSSLAYSFESDGFSGEDLTKFSPHFFTGHTLTGWAFQQVPDRLVWAVRDDGVLLGMTFLPEEQLIAWHQHHTDGWVESVCSIAEGNEDAVYLLVRRIIGGQTKRYVERMASRSLRDIEEAVFVDSALSYDGRNADPAKTLTLSGGTTWQYPEQVTLSASGHAPFSVGSVGRYYRLRTPVLDERGRPVDGEYDQVRVLVTGFTNANTVTVELQVICPESLRSQPLTDWALLASSLSGLQHLEDKTVSILADGNVHPQAVIAAGAVELQYPAAVITVGLPYIAELETLEVDIPGQETLLDKRKAINSVNVFVEASRNFWAGSGPAKLWEQKAPYRNTYDSPVPLRTGASDLKITSTWSTNGRVYIQQPDPLPLTILAIIPDVTISGKS